MFTNDIVGSDAFLEMPSTTQALYFHLGMRCDDDGFVNPNVTMRMTGANKNDLDVLIAKRFLIQFANGVVVIKHHRMNNNWDSRDSKRTVYTEEFTQLFIKENKAYTLDPSQGEKVEFGYRSAIRRVSVGKTAVEEKRIEEKRIEELEEKTKTQPKVITKNFFKGVQDLRKSQVENAQVTSDEGIETQKFLQHLKTNYPDTPKNIIWEEIQKFERYWTEKNSTGKKERWQMNKTFEVSRRLTTWFGKLSTFKKEQINNNKYKAGRIIINTKK